MNSRFIGICLLAMARIGFADLEPSLPPPNAPYVATPRPGSSWEIAVEYKKGRPNIGSADADVNRRPTNIRAEKNGNISRVAVTWNNGTSLIGYVQRDIYIFKSQKTDHLVVVPAQERNLAEPIFVGGYQATAWIGKSDYVGSERFGTDECYKYHRDYSARMIGGDMTIVPEMNAWIRAYDKAPLCVQVGELFFRYRYGRDAAPLTEIPTEVKQKLDQIQIEQNALDMVRKPNTSSQ